MVRPVRIAERAAVGVAHDARDARGVRRLRALPPGAVHEPRAARALVGRAGVGLGSGWSRGPANRQGAVVVRAVVVSFEYSAKTVSQLCARSWPPLLCGGGGRTGSFAYTVSRSRKDGAILQMGQLINPDNGKAVTPHTANSDEWGF